MNIREIVLDYLATNNLDGLFEEGSECGCFIHDLFSCGAPSEECRGGVRALRDGGDGVVFHIIEKAKEGGEEDDQESE